MEVLREIQKLSDEEVEEYCKERIEEFEKYYKNYSERIIGYEVSCNPNFLYEKETDYCVVATHCFYGGYIPLGIKIIFGFDWNGSSYANIGQYYYVDDTSYILEFVKYVRTKEINNEYELFDCMLDFLNNYFAKSKFIQTNHIGRASMCKLISKTENTYYEPINEHSISMFKGRGNAVCTENSILAQNILSFFNIESYILIGMVDEFNTGGSDHAFNLITFTEEETNKTVNYLIDFSILIPRFDIDYNVLNYEPFMVELDELDEKFVDDFISGKRKIEKQLYSFINFAKLSFCLIDKQTVKYYIEDRNPNKNKTKVLEKMRGDADGNN